MSDEKPVIVTTVVSCNRCGFEEQAVRPWSATYDGVACPICQQGRLIDGDHLVLHLPTRTYSDFGRAAKKAV